MRTCDTCEIEKADSAFRKFGRGRKKTCVECEGGGKAVSKRASSREEKQEAPPPKPVKLDGLSLEVARGYGFRASAEDGQLVIEQDADDGTATVVLSRTEFLVLSGQFIGWAESKRCGVP